VAKCAYCGGENALTRCPNCGATAVLKVGGISVRTELYEYQRRMIAAMGIPAHYFNEGPPAPKGDPPRRPQDVMFR
jgi:hypothetical protein